MKILRVNNDNVCTCFVLDDLGTLGNCLNEVRHGFKIENFEETIGDTKDNASSLYKRISTAYHSQKEDPERKDITLSLSQQEVIILINSIIATLKELDYEGEFHCRVGAHNEEAEVLLEQLKQIKFD